MTDTVSWVFIYTFFYIKRTVPRSPRLNSPELWPHPCVGHFCNYSKWVCDFPWGDMDRHLFTLDRECHRPKKRPYADLARRTCEYWGWFQEHTDYCSPVRGKQIPSWVVVHQSWISRALRPTCEQLSWRVSPPLFTSSVIFGAGAFWIL